MKNVRVGVLGLVSVVIMAVLQLCPVRAAAETCEQWVARVASVEGSVQVRRSGDTRWQPIRLNDTLCPGDMIRVQELSRADIFLSNESTLRLDQKTTVTFPTAEKEGTSFVDLLRGALHFFSRFPRGLTVVTPFVNGTIRGTEFLVQVEEERATFSVFEGVVALSNDAGSVILQKGQSAVAGKGQAPAIQVVVRPRDAVQWTLHYPPVIDYRLADLPIGEPKDWRTIMRRSVESYQRGDIEGAFHGISDVPEDIRDPRFFNYRASLLLSVGRVEEARGDIAKALGLAPGNGDALALESVIAVAQNEKAKALDLARKAVDANPRSPSARIALSYAHQARFDLAGALDSLKEAVRLDPENALAWARLAELYSSSGYRDESLKAARKAVELNPNLSRTRAVLGFAHLAQIETKAARESFLRAVELDQADPLPRLGLGLAMIREGDLAPGRTEIEIAASLDPGNSLIRSYLGKAFYEEKRDRLATDQFGMAEELDPSDPTPWFYEAIQKQSVNRPVEALKDMQKAIELNDNRAVYRSRLLLDSDLAARSASLARIYSDLGFQQLALVEGWKSVNTDPVNFSAHRFLADTYSALPRHEIARVSELLQSQLLQPININPVQPSLAEPNLFILNGAGPSEPSFKEFNPLFNRNRLGLQVSGVAGSDSTFGDEIVLSGVWNKLSFSLGQFHYETDGYRANNDQRQNIFNIFAQASLSPDTSVQAEFRSRNIKNGDLSLRFEPDDFSQNLRQETDTSSVRLGFHRGFSPGSDIIGSFVYEKATFDTRDTNRAIDDSDPENPIVLDLINAQKTDQKTYSAELQYLFRAEHVSVVAGAGYFRQDRNDLRELGFIFVTPPLPPDVTSTPIESEIHHTNMYVYSQINFPRSVILTIGGSADFVNDEKGDLVDRSQFNPKVGFTFNPLPTTTLRAAVLRVLRRTLPTTSQTVEPTQVAGFNQFFDDLQGTDSWLYGVGLDQRFTGNLYGGAEYYGRDLEVPGEQRRFDWTERSGRLYLYWTPHPWLALNAEYQYEHFDRERPFTEGIEHLKTNRYPLAIGFFHPSGLMARLKATYFDQEGRFHPQGSDFNEPGSTGSDRFWVVDASVGWRLPKRLGIITLEARNLFDTSFKFQDTDPFNPVIQPKRSVFMKLTLAI